MAKAVILVRSSTRATYEEVLRQLAQLPTSFDELEWIFYGIPRNDELVPLGTGHFRKESIQSLPDDGSHPFVHDAALIDVSGLPKEDATRVFASVLGRRGIRLCSLSRSSARPYVDLLSDPIVSAFRKSLLLRYLALNVITLVAAVGLVAYIATRLGGFSSTSPFVTWLGVFLGLLGVVVSFLSLRRRT